MTTIRILAAGAACLTLLGCSSNRTTQINAVTNPAPCPGASVLFDAARRVQINGEEALANVGFTGEILGVRSLCRYRGDEPIQADLEIDFGFGRGPAAAGSSETYQYFVAVTRRDAVVLAKEVFTVDANFNRGDVVYASDRIRDIVIPRANEDVAGSNFEIVIGFELTEQELEFNRSGVRFRTSVGELASPGN